MASGWKRFTSTLYCALMAAESAPSSRPITSRARRTAAPEGSLESANDRWGARLSDDAQHEQDAEVRAAQSEQPGYDEWLRGFAKHQDPVEASELMRADLAAAR